MKHRFTARQFEFLRIMQAYLGNLHSTEHRDYTDYQTAAMLWKNDTETYTDEERIILNRARGRYIKLINDKQ